MAVEYFDDGFRCEWWWESKELLAPFVGREED